MDRIFEQKWIIFLAKKIDLVLAQTSAINYWNFDCHYRKWIHVTATHLHVTATHLAIFGDQKNLKKGSIKFYYTQLCVVKLDGPFTEIVGRRCTCTCPKVSAKMIMLL